MVQSKSFARYFCILAIGTLLFCSCSRDVEKEECVFDPEVKPKVEFVFEHYEDSLATISSKQKLVDLLTTVPVIRDHILNRVQYPNDSVFINELYSRFTNPAIDTLLMETRRVFANHDQLKDEFATAFTNLKYYYPDFKAPKVQTVITGLLGTDMLVTDSLIVVSLDFFLGPDGKYRPRMYEYILRRYDPEDIVPSVMLIYGIDTRTNKTNLQDKTVLADMIAYGKSFYFAKHMLPCTPDSVFLWYSSGDIKGARENEDLIWARLIEDKVLFSTSMIDKRNYLGERPYTIQVGEKCPGRIAQWVGWRIVKEYMKNHPEVTLQQLMVMNNADALFKESRYKPQRR